MLSMSLSLSGKGTAFSLLRNIYLVSKEASPDLRDGSFVSEEAHVILHPCQENSRG